MKSCDKNSNPTNLLWGLNYFNGEKGSGNNYHICKDSIFCQHIPFLKNVKIIMCFLLHIQNLSSYIILTCACGWKDSLRYCRTWLFCFCITWYLVGFSNTVRTWKVKWNRFHFTITNKSKTRRIVSKLCLITNFKEQGIKCILRVVAYWSSYTFNLHLT